MIELCKRYKRRERKSEREGGRESAHCECMLWEHRQDRWWFRRLIDSVLWLSRERFSWRQADASQAGCTRSCNLHWPNKFYTKSLFIFLFVSLLTIFSSSSDVCWTSYDAFTLGEHVFVLPQPDWQNERPWRSQRHLQILKKINNQTSSPISSEFCLFVCAWISLRSEKNERLFV